MALASAKIWKWIFLKIDIFGRFFVIYDEMEASWCDAPPIFLQVWLTPEEKIFVTFISSQNVAFVTWFFSFVTFWRLFDDQTLVHLKSKFCFEIFHCPSVHFGILWYSGRVPEMCLNKKIPGVEFGDARTTFFSLKMINF